MIPPPLVDHIEALIKGPSHFLKDGDRTINVSALVRCLYVELNNTQEQLIRLTANARASFKRDVFKCAVAGLCLADGNDRTMLQRALTIAEASAAEFFDEKQPRQPPTSIPPQRRKEE